jgi:hypothetical protein
MVLSPRSVVSTASAKSVFFPPGVGCCGLPTGEIIAVRLRSPITSLASTSSAPRPNVELLANQHTTDVLEENEERPCRDR